MVHYSRAGWGARAPRPGGNAVTNGPKGVAFHYNGPRMGIDPGAACQCGSHVRQIQAFHMDSRGWNDIAYDVIACPHGNTYQGRLGTVNGTGANGTTTANRDYMAVMALIGDGEAMSDPLKAALLRGRELCRQAGAGSAITGHYQHQSTACPGTAIKAWIQAGTPNPSGGTPVAYPTLRRGDRGTAVTTAQKRLIEHGHKLPQYGADGSFGAETDAAVRAFQRAAGLDVDGVIGPDTWAALLANPAAPPPPFISIPTPTPVATLDDVYKVLVQIRDALKA